MNKLNKRFKATLQKSPAKGGWTYVIMSNSAKYFDTGGRVKVRGIIDGEKGSARGLLDRSGDQDLCI